MNNLDLSYQQLVFDVLSKGKKKQTRNGEVLSVFGRQIRHNMRDGFPLLTTKKMAWKQIVVELLWFLRGDTNIEYLVDNGCNIWNGDAYENFKKKFNAPAEAKGHLFKIDKFVELIKTTPAFAAEWGDLGPIYGKQWRRWKQYIPYNVTEDGCKVATVFTDQIASLINELKTNPDSRRLLVNAWNVGELDQMVLPPCHYGFQCWTRELTWDEQVQWVLKNTDIELENVYIVEEIAKNTTPTRAISLMWNQRSVDIGLGWPFNVASYGLLLTILAKKVNMVPDELICNLGDCHIYSNQVDGLKEQLTRIPYRLPKVSVSDRPIEDISEYTFEDFELEDYTSHSAIKLPLSN